MPRLFMPERKRLPSGRFYANNSPAAGRPAIDFRSAICYDESIQSILKGIIP